MVGSLYVLVVRSTIQYNLLIFCVHTYVTKIMIYVVFDLSCLYSRDLSLLTAKQKSLATR